MQIERHVELPVDPDAVWEALTDDTLLGEWLGDGATLNPELGGDVSIADGDLVRRGVVEQVEPGRRLAFVWWPEDDPLSASEVSFDLVTVPAGTRLDVVERPLAPMASARMSATMSVGALHDVRLVLLAAVSCRAATRVWA